ncbi:pyridoxamine 5'-phosphate oxidase family protein [Marinobacterium aestuariivivens]|uniref:Pyridoxamine 5'-phosphate oxidase family protein n=1 Tax=Marinobacterium aestuariivivens TaxID=1698799 RepID=A0ABW1ZYW7_9GAMM
MSTIEVTDRTRLRRGPKRASYDRETIYRILDEALVCHIGASMHGGPAVQPNFHWRIGDELYVHGSSRNGLFQSILAGESACITVTLLDGLVFARSAFHHSANFRSVMLYGKGRRVEDPVEKRQALDSMLEKFSPGRSAEARPPNETEMKATAVIAFPIEEVSAKIRSGGPVDDAEDLDWPAWSGVRPLITTLGDLIPD